MLIPRIITGIILIVAGLFLIFSSTPIVFFLITGAVTLWGAYEWGNLIGLKKSIFKIIYLILVACVMWLNTYYSIHVILYLSLVFLWWVIAAVLIYMYPKATSTWAHSIPIKSLMGIFCLVPAWWSLNMIRQFIPVNTTRGIDQYAILLFMLLVIWSADIGAYFAGRWFGKHKLMETVSPKKTWEGCLGGMLLALLVAVIFCIITQENYLLLFAVIPVVIFSVVGDLFESMIKRIANVKDSGKVLPGHGGILDRMDSVLSGAPVFLFCCALIQWLF